MTAKKKWENEMKLNSKKFANLTNFTLEVRKRKLLFAFGICV